MARRGQFILIHPTSGLVADTVAFLLGEGARNYTGAVFDLNNGFHL